MNVLFKKVDDGFWKKCRSKAALEGITMKQLVIDLLRAWLKEPKRS